MGDSMIDWTDLYFKDFGASQIKDKKELVLKQKKMKSFYTMILTPLYKPVQKSRKFKFSVSDDKLTERIMYQDLMKYYDLHTAEDVLNKIGELDSSFVPKIEPILKRVQEIKENKRK